MEQIVNFVFQIRLDFKYKVNVIFRIVEMLNTQQSMNVNGNPFIPKNVIVVQIEGLSNPVKLPLNEI